MSMNGEKRGAMRMPLPSPTAAVLAIATMLGLLSMGACSKGASLKAMFTFKQANQAYQVQDWRRAAQLYEETIQGDPSLVQVYFFLGNSYDNLYKPGVTGQPANDELLAKAIQNYQLAAEKLSADNPEDLKLKRLALQYLIAAYGTDKMNDPAKAEPVILRLIELDPSEPANYFALARIYEDAGAYEQAEQVLLRAKEAKPSDTAVYMQLARYYNTQGQFDKTIESLEQRAEREPNNPEAFYTIATYYWDKTYRDPRLRENEKKDYVERGLTAIDRSLQLKPDYIEALVWKNLLLRLQANIEKNPARQQALIKEADVLRDKAESLRKLKATGVGD